MKQNSQYLALPRQEFYLSNRRKKDLEAEDSIKYGFPVNFQKCQIHRKANLICKNIYKGPFLKSARHQKCECCGRVVGDDPYKELCYDPLQLAVYGPGIPLYFLFLTYIIKVLGLFLGVFGLYAFFSNLSQNDCSKHKRCSNAKFINSQSLLNSYEAPQIVANQLYLLILLILLLVVVFQYIRNRIKTEKKFSDSFLISPSDFAIILRRMTPGTSQHDIEKEIAYYRAFLSEKEKLQTDNLAIHKILFAFNLDQYVEVEQANLESFRQCVTQGRQFQKLPTPQITQKLNTAIVIFQKQKSKQMFLGYVGCLQQTKKYCWIGYRPLSNLFSLNGTYISVERAPEPDDIIWENVGRPMEELFIRKISIFVMSLILLGLGGVLQFLLAKWRRQYQTTDYLIQHCFSLLSAGLVTGINFGLEMALIWSSSYQKAQTHTLLKISLTVKIVLLQFLNTGVVYIFISAFIYLPEFRFYKSMIASDILYIMGMNLVFNNIFNFICVYFQLPNLLPRYWLSKEKKVYTQLEANQIYEANIVDLEYKYAYIFKTLWLTAFFMPTVPSVAVISIATLVLNYWSEKYLFSGCYTIPEMFSAKLSIAVLDLLNYTPLWLTFGSYFIHLLRANFHFGGVPPHYQIMHLICLIVSLFNIFAPLPRLVKDCFQKDGIMVGPSKSYGEEKYKFQTTYQQTNPAYNGGTLFKDKSKQLGTDLIQSYLRNPQSAFYQLH